MSDCGRTSQYEKDLYELRQSVRRLVGEWAENAIYSSDNARSATYEQGANELSALIDGKGEG